MKKLLTLAAVAALMFSCSENPTPEPEPTPTPPPTQEKWAINISTSITRATDTSFENGDKVGIYVVNQPNALKTSGNHVDNIGFTYSGSWSAATPIYWKDETTKADFYCYYPYASSISNVETYSFAVKTDQSSVANYKASDFLWGKTAGVAPTKDAVGITVKHAMSNVIVKLIAGNGYTAEDMASATVAICGLKTNSTINLASGVVTATGDVAEITPMVENDYRRALVVPQSISNADLIKVTIGDKVYTLNQSIEFKSGKQHTCTLTVERTNQGINIGIDGWETESDDFGGTVE
jgi:hypothetical protein